VVEGRESEPAGAAGAVLFGVAYPGTRNSDTVGTYTVRPPGKPSIERTLVERWNATHWSIVPSLNPPGKTATGLTAVTCTSPTNCVAVGAYSANYWQWTLIGHWDGTRWSIVPSPNPRGKTYPSLNSVTCIETTSCFAVGG